MKESIEDRVFSALTTREILSSESYIELLKIMTKEDNRLSRKIARKDINLCRHKLDQLLIQLNCELIQGKNKCFYIKSQITGDVALMLDIGDGN